MKYATWVLTHISEELFGEHEFTCSNCMNTIFGHNYLTEDRNHYDLNTTSKEVLEESPYCCKCGCKMKKDSQLQHKRNQYEKSYKDYKLLYRTSHEPWNIPMYKIRWKIDEVVEKPNKEIPF